MFGYFVFAKLGCFLLFKYIIRSMNNVMIVIEN